MRMLIKVFETNNNGKIEFTREELEKLLNDTYAEGQRNCNCGSNITWTNPYIAPYISATNREAATSNASEPKAHTITTALNATDAKEMSKCVDEIIKNATARIDNDAFSKLARELNF